MSDANIAPSKRILVVDDNRSIHNDFRKILAASENGAFEVAEMALFDGPPPVQLPIYEIDFAHQGQEAVALAEQALRQGRPYALAFVDVRMPPGMDGVETTAKIWRLCPEMQIVLCTAYSDYSWDELIAKLWHSDRLVILKKPFESAEVLQLAAVLTDKFRLTREAQSHTDASKGNVARSSNPPHETTDRPGIQIPDGQKAAGVANEGDVHYKALFEENPLPMWVFDLKTFELLASNLIAKERFGYSEAVALAKNLKAQHSRDKSSCPPNQVLAQNAVPSTDGFTSELHTNDGCTITIEIGLRAIIFAGHEAALVLAQDVTERNKLQQRLLQAQAA